MVKSDQGWPNDFFLPSDPLYLLFPGCDVEEVLDVFSSALLEHTVIVRSAFVSSSEGLELGEMVRFAWTMRHDEDRENVAQM